MSNRAFWHCPYDKFLRQPLIETHVYQNVGHGFFDYETGEIDKGFLDQLEAFIVRTSGHQ